MKGVNEYFKAIKHLNYVVQRNWWDLPNIDPVHPDLDLFVSVEHHEELQKISNEFDIHFADIRDSMDNYYPPYIADILLDNPTFYHGFYIPTPKAHFLSLYYHATVHKKENRYQAELKKTFLKWIPPVVPDDRHVGFFL